MAAIRCPSCGKENPDSLTFCQFCQEPLTTTLQIGEKPTKKNTGELEPVLPEWLRDVRKQARELAEEDAAEAATKPNIPKVEPPDLLAGLANQTTGAEEDEIPDWLASLTPKSDDRPATPPIPSKSDSDFFAQFEQSVPDSKNEPEPQEPSSGLGSPASQPAAPPERDELSEWFAQASEQPGEPFSFESDSSQVDAGWEGEKQIPFTPSGQASPERGDDLSWLRNLEAESKRTSDLPLPKKSDDWSFGFGEPAQPGASNQDDLSWLDSLGSLPASEPPKEEPAKPSDGLSWLHDLGALPPREEPVEPDSQFREDLSWLNAFADSSPPAQSESIPPVSQDDLDWLTELGGAPRSPQASDQNQEQSPAGEDLGWLHDLQTGSAPLADFSFEQPAEPTQATPFTPRQTAPLGERAEPSIPDWLKSATEEPSLPLGTQALDQMREDNKPAASNDAFAKAIFGAAIQSSEEQPAASPPEPASASDTSPLIRQDVDAIFSEDLPDWLTSAVPESLQPAEEIGINAEGGETLSPADLPSWVQAMRPVEAVIVKADPGVDNQPIEREGPLAGLKGVIPAAAIGSLRRPQPIPLKLQATTGQQASAGILEEILLGETTTRPLVSRAVVTSQPKLRWLIAALIFFVIGAVVFSGTQLMPVPASLPPMAMDIPGVVMNIPENAPVLVILDYEPALAGEMEAVSGPLLDQLVLLRDPYLSFLATSPTGNALVERLLDNTNINRPDGQELIAGQNYSNLGYLPGGESGVLAFIQSPQAAIPVSPVLEFSEYAAIFILTDHTESARVWIEQLYTMKQTDPMLASQPLLAVSSAQAGPMLQPYFYSGQINGLINGLPAAVRYELGNNNRPGLARSYWDAFGVGMMMAIALILLGGLVSLFLGVRARRMQAAEE